MTSDRRADPGLGFATSARETRAGEDAVDALDALAAREAQVGPSLTLDDLGIRPHNCFACGELNTCGLHLPLHLEPGRCWTEFALPERFEGWEGVIHGGVLSTVLDEVMGWALMEADSWGVTAKLSVSFRAPVAPAQPIRAEAWITERRRRVQRTAGRIVDCDTGAELVTAEAVYVSAKENRKRELQERYGLLVADRRGLERERGTGQPPGQDGRHDGGGSDGWPRD